MAATIISDQIYRLLEQMKWDDARLVIQKQLKRIPEDDPIRHWWLTRLSTTYYEQRDYRKALELVQQAAAIAPNCPLVLWDLAGTLDMLGRQHEAIAIYDKLIARGVRAIASDECGEGLRWAKGLVNDCWYRRAACYESLGNDEPARRSLEQFQAGLTSRTAGIYTSEDAEKLAKRLVTGSQSI